MQIVKSPLLQINTPFNLKDLSEGVFIIVLHAKRIPPHIGMVVNNSYHSLSIKGQELSVELAALHRNIIYRKIPSLFLKLSLEVIDPEYLQDLFQSKIKQFDKVNANGVTCLSPIKLFLNDLIPLPMEGVEFIYELLPLLHANNYIEFISAINVENNQFQLPIYSNEELNNQITIAHKIAVSIKPNSN
jgi:hypothetical protein